MEEMKTYTIKKGDHYSAHLPKLYFGKSSFDIVVNFDESCRYDLGNDDQLDVNKLFGVSFGNHENNSIRIGWNYNLLTRKIHLFTYCYQNGVRSMDWIGCAKINEDYRLRLNLHFDAGTFTISSSSTNSRELLFKFPSLKLGYYLFPYFGGNQTAPHDIIINLEVN